MFHFELGVFLCSKCPSLSRKCFKRFPFLLFTLLSASWHANFRKWHNLIGRFSNSLPNNSNKKIPKIKKNFWLQAPSRCESGDDYKFLFGLTDSHLPIDHLFSQLSKQVHSNFQSGIAIPKPCIQNPLSPGQQKVSLVAFPHLADFSSRWSTWLLFRQLLNVSVINQLPLLAERLIDAILAIELRKFKFIYTLYRSISRRRIFDFDNRSPESRTGIVPVVCVSTLPQLASPISTCLFLNEILCLFRFVL